MRPHLKSWLKGVCPLPLAMVLLVREEGGRVDRVQELLLFACVFLLFLHLFLLKELWLPFASRSLPFLGFCLPKPSDEILVIEEPRAVHYSLLPPRQRLTADLRACGIRVLSFPWGTLPCEPPQELRESLGPSPTCNTSAPHETTALDHYHVLDGAAGQLVGVREDARLVTELVRQRPRGKSVAVICPNRS